MKDPNATLVIPAVLSVQTDVGGRKIGSNVVNNIQTASQKTGVSFAYLMAQASRESGFSEQITTDSSSASGLFQFTKQTWLAMIKDHGAAHGLAQYSDAIVRTGHGEYVVTDAKMRQQILDLRRDSSTSAVMAGEYARDNRGILEKQLGRPVNSADLYVAHFLGAGGAAKFLKAHDTDPTQAADALVPKAAHANHSIFYDEAGAARSVGAVYDQLKHAIDKPMHQFAHYEAKIAANAKKTASSDGVWPFEQGNWPPPYQPNPATAHARFQAANLLVAEAIPVPEGSEGDLSQTISSAMPPKAQAPSPQGKTAETTSPSDIGGTKEGLLASLKRGLFG